MLAELQGRRGASLVLLVMNGGDSFFLSLHLFPLCIPDLTGFWILHLNRMRYVCR